jgi:hypothetical protein
MNSQILFLDSQERSAEIARQAELRRRQRGGAPASQSALCVVIRPAGEPDRAAIERLSQLEGRRLDGRLDGRMLVAEDGGEVRAAVAIGSGAVLADPFRRTAEMVELLERHRAHLNGVGGDRASRLGSLCVAVRDRLRSPKRAGASAPTVLGNETSLLR